MTMNNMNMTKVNDPSNYTNTNADFGFRSKGLPDKAVFATLDKEAIYETMMPYNNTPHETVLSMLDDLDYAIIEETGRSKYITSLQMYQFVTLRGFQVKRDKITTRIKKLMRYRILHEFEMKLDSEGNGFRFYELDFRGFRIACDRGIVFHMGNRFLSGKRKQEEGFIEDCESVKRILAGNMIIIGLLRNEAAMERFGIMETLRPDHVVPVTDGCIIRPTVNVQIDENSILLYEVVRSTPHALSKLKDKVGRYYQLLHSQDYLEHNVHGHKTMPQLIICAESLEHARKIDGYLRAQDMWNAEDPILYTHDLVHVGSSLRSVYELDENGRQSWYSLPWRGVKEGKYSA